MKTFLSITLMSVSLVLSGYANPSTHQTASDIKSKSKQYGFMKTSVSKSGAVHRASHAKSAIVSKVNSSKAKQYGFTKTSVSKSGAVSRANAVQATKSVNTSKKGVKQYGFMKTAVSRPGAVKRTR